jgi:hypothetical protein
MLESWQGWSQLLQKAVTALTYQDHFGKLLLATGKANVDSNDIKYDRMPLSWPAEMDVKPRSSCCLPRQESTSI